jgi:tryptophan 7-halogenase
MLIEDAMGNSNIQSVAIIGGGSAGWLSAATLATMLGQDVSITIVDCAIENTSPKTGATLPPLKAILQMLRLEEVKLLAATQGTLKLGSQFVNWGALGNRYFHPHGTYGAEFDVVPLHHWWLKARAETHSVPTLDDLSLASVLAKEGRFCLPEPDRRLIQSTLDYAYHMDDGLLSLYLAHAAASLGVAAVQADVTQVHLSSETGHVESVALSDGTSLKADFYIDCSGPQGLLIDKALKAPFENWSNYLPCDKAISLACQSGPDFSPATRITQREAGWQWRVPLQHQTSMGYIYASAHQSDDDASAILMDNLDGSLIGAQTVTNFTNGRITTPFHKNVLALGDAAGFLEPLEATGLHMVQSALTRLLALWPDRNFDPALARAYNEVTTTEWERTRDFLILHYHATTRTDTPLWRTCKDMAIPNSLAQRIAYWRASGRLISPGPETFQSASWLSVLVGQDLASDGWDPLADYRAQIVDSKARLDGLARIIQETAAAAPAHRAFVDKNCKAPRI